MKKRILALALAGTTAFSVFGAALSANAAETWPSAQNATWAGTNDAYKHYTPVAGSLVSSYKGPAVGTTTYCDPNNQYHKFTIDSTLTESDKDNDVYISKADYVQDHYDVQENYTAYKHYVKADGSNVVDLLVTEGTGANNGDTNASRLAGANIGTTVVNGIVTGYTYGGQTFVTDSYGTALDKVLKAAGADLTKTATYYWAYGDDPHGSGSTASTGLGLTDKQWEALKKVTDYTPAIISNTTGGAVADGTVTVNAKYGATTTKAWKMDGSTSADTTIYPWTTTTKYVQYGNGYYTDVDQAESTPTVYLIDFIPANSTSASSSDIAYYYNNAKAENNYMSTVAGVIAAGSTTEDTDKTGYYVGTWTAETGYGTSYGVRGEVISDYEDFLSELILLQRYGDYTVSEANFKAEYNDRFVSGYYYNPYTGLATSYEWKTDLYNISELLDDIYDSSVGNHYKDMNTSELLYLMQQYDKYIGNYVNKAEVEKDAWGDLLVSILENVTEDDFKKSADYKTFARKAEDAIDAYDDAETSSMIKSAEQAMYNLVVAEQAKTSGAADEKKALNSDLYSLYFNVKNLPVNYTTSYAVASNAALTNYSYIAAVTTVADSTWASDYSIDTLATTTTGHYSLYPQADYAETGNGVVAYVGNTAAAYTGNATDEYEWFLNVYELAGKVNDNSKVVAGVVTAVNDALNEAVEALEVTRPATATAESALDEMIEHYEDVLDFYVTGNGVNEEDFSATYYAPYTAALEYAEVAEGAAQVANARHMVEVAAEALTYNGAQVTVTKNDIKTVTAAITDGQAALKAIKDSKDYNAAQVTALNKAIDQAQDVVDIYNAKYSSSYNKVNHIPTSVVGDKDGIVKSDITGAIDAINAAIDYSEIIMGWSKNDAGKWLYGTDEGYLNNGWNKIGSVWYYFNEDGTAKQSEWMQENGQWYWFNSNAGAAIGWAKVDGEWYYFGGNNAMKTGWQKVDGNWYYLASSGKMVTGWAQVDGKWYYMSKESNSLGQMLANTTTPDGYKVGADGAML